MEPQPEQLPPKSRFERLKEEQKNLRREMRNRMIGAITGAFGIVAGIAWNDAVRAAIDHFYPPSKGVDIFPKFLYALIVTIVVSILIYAVSRIFAEREEKKG